MTITFVGAGAAVTGNNTSVVPAAHASTAAGDLKLILASIRNSGTGTVDTPAGWTKVVDAGNVALLGRFHVAGDAAPTVTFTGGAALADTIAQCATWRGVEPSLAGILAAAPLLNGSAQNIAFPALTIPADAHLAIVAGWKQDDWTSVATLAGMTEIGEPVAIAGNDAGQVWDYVIQTAAANIAAASFVVTGGVAAISRGLTVAVRPAATLAAAVQNVFPPRVQLSATGLTVGDDVALYRVVAGVRTLLRGGAAESVLDPAFVVVDAELPFGVPVRYVLVVNGAAEYEVGPNTYTLTGGRVAVTDAVSGLAAEVVILAWPERQYGRDASTFRVGGRNVGVLGDVTPPAGAVELYVDTTSGSENLGAVLAEATQGVVQIRQPGGYAGIDSYQMVLGATERRFSQDGSDERRIWAVDVLESEPWAAVLESPGFTLQDIADAYAGFTLAELAGDYATLLDVAQADWS